MYGKGSLCKVKVKIHVFEVGAFGLSPASPYGNTKLMSREKVLNSLNIMGRLYVPLIRTRDEPKTRQ